MYDPSKQIVHDGQLLPKQYPDLDTALNLNEEYLGLKAGDTLHAADMSFRNLDNQKALYILHFNPHVLVENIHVTGVYRNFDKLDAIKAANPALYAKLLPYGNLHIDMTAIFGNHASTVPVNVTIRDTVFDIVPPTGNRDCALVGCIKDQKHLKTLLFDNFKINGQFRPDHTMISSDFQFYLSPGCSVDEIIFQNGCTGSFIFMRDANSGSDCNIVVKNCPDLIVRTANWRGQVIRDAASSGTVIAGPTVPPSPPVVHPPVPPVNPLPPVMPPVSPPPVASKKLNDVTAVAVIGAAERVDAASQKGGDIIVIIDGEVYHFARKIGAPTYPSKIRDIQRIAILRGPNRIDATSAIDGDIIAVVDDQVYRFKRAG